MRSQHHLARRTALLGGTMLPAWPLRSVLLSGAALPIWPQRASAFRFGVSSEAPEPDNIFQKILRGEAPADVLDDTDGDLFSFRDKNPASTLHFLVIPRRFIRDASLLTPDDMQLVQRMTEKARELIKREVGDAFDEDELALGFHWPPWYSVPWLHLHAIYPISRMHRRYKYTPLSFKSPSYVLRRLAAQRARREQSA